MRAPRHPIRLSLRSLWLCGEFVLAASSYLFTVALRRADSPSEARAYWLHRGCRRVLRVFNIEVQAQGTIPRSGLLVCNHLSYLDILVLSAITPAVFVAKREVKFWPILGWFAFLAGTVFVDRERRTRVGKAVDEIDDVLKASVVTVLFPEGTSSDGRTVLPFKSSLLEPAIKTSCPLSVCRLGYELEDGDPTEEVCYWKDMTLVPHLLNLLTKSCIKVSIRFAETRQHRANRKELARALHSEVVEMDPQRSRRSTPLTVQWRPKPNIHLSTSSMLFNLNRTRTIPPGISVICTEHLVSVRNSRKATSKPQQ